MRYLILLFLLITTNAYSATEILKTVKPSGGDYTSMEACLDDNEQNLVTNDSYLVCVASGDWTSAADTTQISISGYTTDATRYIELKVDESDRHNGVWDDSKYRVVWSTSTSDPIQAYEDFVYIDGFQISRVAATNNDRSIIRSQFINAGGKHYYTNIIGKQTGGTSSSIILAIYGADADVTIHVVNSLFYDFKTSSTSNFNRVLAAEYIYNVTIVDSVRALDGGVAKNLGNVNSTYSDTGSPTYTTSSTSTPTFVDASSDNYLLDSSDTTWKDQGTDLSSDATYAFSDDIQGETRSGTWDIGADEYVAGVAATRRFIFVN